MPVHTRLVAATAVVLCAGGAVLASPTAEAAPRAVTGGSVSVDLTSAAVTQFANAGVRVGSGRPATYARTVLRFPIASGSFVESSGEYAARETGTLRLVRGSSTVVISKLAIDSRTKLVTGSIAGAAVSTVFVVGDPQAGGGSPSSRQYSRYTVDWTRSAARTLNAKLRTAVFGAAGAVGSGATDLRFG
ncbi:hypothetical protein [Jatrophihabitans fulvus]